VSRVDSSASAAGNLLFDCGYPSDNGLKALNKLFEAVSARHKWTYVVDDVPKFDHLFEFGLKLAFR
jgi:hypothetical protein